MKLLFVRHGDPDYAIDSLTEKGWREAELLSRRLARVPARAYYTSPLGRAKDTASLTLKKTGRTAVECPWLREFDAPIWRPDVPNHRIIPWDWLPQDWMAREHLFHPDRWREDETLREGGVPEEYDRVTGALDEVLCAHGYERADHWYRALQPNNDTLIFFCHFGVESVLLSHLLNVSPFILWHGTCAAPASVTTVVTEERRKGIASFRMSSFGDISHLYCAGEEPSFAARFCECLGNEGERSD